MFPDLVIGVALMGATFATALVGLACFHNAKATDLLGEAILMRHEKPLRWLDAKIVPLKKAA